MHVFRQPYARNPSCQRNGRGSLPTNNTEDTAGSQAEGGTAVGPAVGADAQTADQKAATAESGAAARERGRMRRELRAKDAATVLQHEKERRELQESVLWWFANDILMPYI